VKAAKPSFGSSPTPGIGKNPSLAATRIIGIAAG
jgi:hypothetical protein